MSYVGKDDLGQCLVLSVLVGVIITVRVTVRVMARNGAALRFKVEGSCLGSGSRQA